MTGAHFILKQRHLPYLILEKSLFKNKKAKIKIGWPQLTLTENKHDQSASETKALCYNRKPIFSYTINKRVRHKKNCSALKKYRCKVGYTRGAAIQWDYLEDQNVTAEKYKTLNQV